MVKQKDKPVNVEKDLLQSGCELILYNDEVNSFDYVIDSLVEVCGHEIYQAEQCTFIAHYKGKCAVKSGSFHELKPKFDELIRRGLTATIDSK
ncbi:MAG: ATP-dependent Clp protease adaptor ClpS [Bacteroidota bacterium]